MVYIDLGCRDQVQVALGEGESYHKGVCRYLYNVAILFLPLGILHNLWELEELVQWGLKRGVGASRASRQGDKFLA